MRCLLAKDFDSNRRMRRGPLTSLYEVELYTVESIGEHNTVVIKNDGVILKGYPDAGLKDYINKIL